MWVIYIGRWTSVEIPNTHKHPTQPSRRLLPDSITGRGHLCGTSMGKKVMAFCHTSEPLGIKDRLKHALQVPRVSRVPRKGPPVHLGGVTHRQPWKSRVGVQGTKSRQPIILLTHSARCWICLGRRLPLGGSVEAWFFFDLLPHILRQFTTSHSSQRLGEWSMLCLAC